MSVQHHRSILSAKIFLETELGEAVNEKDIYLKSDHGTQLILWTSRAWYTTVIPEMWPRDATSTLTLNSLRRRWSVTDTQPFSEKWPRGATSKPWYKHLNSDSSGLTCRGRVGPPQCVKWWWWEPRGRFRTATWVPEEVAWDGYLDPLLERLLDGASQHDLPLVLPWSRSGSLLSTASGQRSCGKLLTWLECTSVTVPDLVWKPRICVRSLNCSATKLNSI